jgi:membrane-associated protein
VTDLLDSLLDQLDQLPLWAVLVTVGCVMALETTMLVGVVVPGDLVVLFAGSTADSPAELVLVVVAVTAGSLAGETVGYGLGRRWGPALRTSRLGRHLGDERWDKAGDYLERRGGWAVFLARYLAAIHAVTPVVAGSVGMRYRRFIGWCAAGGVTWSTLYVVLGALAGASYRRWSEAMGAATTVVLGGLAGAALFAAGAVLRERLARQGRVRLMLGPLGLLRLELRDAVGLGGLAAVVGVAVGAADATGGGVRAPDAIAYALALGGVAVLVGWRRWPVPVLGVTLVAFVAYHLLDYPAGPPVLAVVVAVYGAAVTGRLPLALGAAGLVTGSAVAFRGLVEHTDALGTDVALAAALLVCAALLGDSIRSRRTLPCPDPDPTVVTADPTEPTPLDEAAGGFDLVGPGGGQRR